MKEEEGTDDDLSDLPEKIDDEDFLNSKFRFKKNFLFSHQYASIEHVV